MGVAGGRYRAALVNKKIFAQARNSKRVTGKAATGAVSCLGKVYLPYPGLQGLQVFSEWIEDIELVWHTVNDAGELLANGVYLYQVWVRIGEIWYPLGVQKLAVIR